MHSAHHKLRTFDFPWQQFNKLLQPLVELWNLHTAGTNKCACIWSLYQLLICRSRLWNSQMDVQRRWLCAVVTSCSGVRHFLQWLLPSLVHNHEFRRNCEQQASARVNKTIMCDTVSMYQSQRVDERGMKQTERKDLKFLIQVFWDVTLFQLVKSYFPEKNNSSIFRIKQYKENIFFL